MPDPEKRKRNETTVFEGTRSRYFADAVMAFDTLLDQFEASLAGQPWLAGQSFSLAYIAYSPYMTRLDHLQMAPMWDNRLRVAEWYRRLRARKGYQESLARWFNAKYLSLMQEKGRQEWPAIAVILERKGRGEAGQ